MTDASEADGQAAVPAEQFPGGPRDAPATAAPGAAADTGTADSGPADVDGSANSGAADPDVTSTDTGPPATSADSSPAAAADTSPAASDDFSSAASADTSRAASAGAGPDPTSADARPARGSGPDAGSAGGAPGLAAEWGVADTRRAETYLRLLAESELRVALAFRRIKPPSQGLAAPAAWAAVEAAVTAVEFVMRPVRPVAVRAGRAARPWAESAAKVLAPPARLLAPPARRAGEAVTMAGWRARGVVSWIASRRPEPEWHDDTPSARTCLRRVEGAASALAATGALGAETTRSVADNMERALMLRHLIEDEGPYYAHLAAVRWQTQATPPPAGPVRAIPVGATVGIETHGERARIHLLALVLADGQAMVTMIAQPAADRDERTDGKDTDQDTDEDTDLPDLYMIIDNLKIHGTDDRGGTYRLRMDSGGGSDRLWEGQFSLTPVPPPGVRWLEITMMPGQSPVRIDLPPVSAADAADAAGPAPAGRTPPSVPGRAERFIDIASQGLLGGLDGPGPVEAVQYLMPEIADQVQALQAVGALMPGSPALARLLVLARRRGCRIPAELTAVAEAAAVTGVVKEQREDLLPEAWRAVLELIDTVGGFDDPEDDYVDYDYSAAELTAIAPATAVLPELDGARCVVTGIRSAADGTSVKVLAWGWPAAQFGPHEPGARQFRWLARDDAGHWHVGYESGGSYGDGAAEFELKLTPPADLAATSLELMLLGLNGEVSATLPLNWMEL